MTDTIDSTPTNQKREAKYPHELLIKHLPKITSAIIFILAGVFVGGLIFVPDQFPNFETDVVLIVLMCICGFITSFIGDKCDG